MEHDTKTRVKVTIETSAPFSVTLEPREGETALFYINHSGNGPLDASWIPVLIAELKDAEKYAEMLDDTPHDHTKHRRK